MKGKMVVRVGLAALIVLMVIGLGGIGASRQSVDAQSARQAPIFEVDPLWPKPLPNPRLQRFIYKGVGPVTKAEQGVVRPKAR